VSDLDRIEPRVMVIGAGADAQRAVALIEAAGHEVVSVPHAGANGDERPSGAYVLGAEGQIGGFSIRLADSSDPHVSVGAIVVALGNRRVRPSLSLPKGSQLPVMTPAAWADKVRRDLREAYRVAWARKRVVVLLDHPADTPRETATEALRAVKNVVGWAHPEIYVYYRDLQVDTHQLERLTRETREAGVVYCRYDQIELDVSENGVTVAVEEGQRWGDLLVVPEIIEPPASATDLATRLGIRVGEDGFLQDVNMRHVGAGQTVRRGIYVAGRCHLDADAETQAADVERVVGRVVALLDGGTVPLPEQYAEVTSEECIRCLTCIRTCPHQAVELRSTETVTAAYVVPAACWGCGMCVANCPVRAIALVPAVELAPQEAV
jgi:Pyruvate/2-oxoacid:ferredoxin oxidoreductase delta subunit